MSKKQQDKPSGRVAGGKKTAVINLARDPDFYKKIGHIGGSKPTTKLKGFAANRERASSAGRVGGQRSRRVKKPVEGKV